MLQEIQLRGMDQTKSREGQSPGKSLNGGTVTCSAPAHSDLGWTSVQNPCADGVPTVTLAGQVSPC